MSLNLQCTICKFCSYYVDVGDIAVSKQKLFVELQVHMVAWKIALHWLAQLSNLTQALLLMKWKLTASRAELQNLQILKKCWKCQVSFSYHSSTVSRKAWTLPWILQELKTTLRKLAVANNTGNHWMKEVFNLVMMKLCVSWAN